MQSLLGTSLGVFIGLTVVIIGGAAIMTGRALADGWKPAKHYTVAESATWAHPALLGKNLLVKDVNKLTLWSFE